MLSLTILALHNIFNSVFSNRAMQKIVKNPQTTTENQGQQTQQQSQKQEEKKSVFRLIMPEIFYKLQKINTKFVFIQQIMSKLLEWKYLQYDIGLCRVLQLEQKQGHAALNALYDICLVCLGRLLPQKKTEENCEKDEIVANFTKDAFVWGECLRNVFNGEILWLQQQKRKQQSELTKTITTQEALEKILQIHPKLTDQQTIAEKTACMNDLCLIVKATWGITEFTEIIMRQQLSLVAKMNSHIDFVHQMYNQLYDVVITILQKWEQINQQPKNQEELQKNQRLIMQECGKQLEKIEQQINEKE